MFAKGVAKGLGIEEEVTSPTYAYMNDYDGKLFHYDCYRIESPENRRRRSALRTISIWAESVSWNGAAILLRSFPNA